MRPDTGRKLPPGITPRELTALLLLAYGLTVAAMGRRLSRSVHTVTKHQANLYRKFDTNDQLHHGVVLSVRPRAGGRRI